MENRIAVFFAYKLSREELKGISGGLIEEDKCHADCPSSSTKRGLDCSCPQPGSCWATDDVGCGCGMLPEFGCDA